MKLTAASCDAMSLSTRWRKPGLFSQASSRNRGRAAGSRSKAAIKMDCSFMPETLWHWRDVKHNATYRRESRTIFSDFSRAAGTSQFELPSAISVASHARA
jgi:hypothetical protein